MSSAALTQIANALQNGIGLSISTTGYTWDSPPPIGFGAPNTALFTSLSTTTFATSSFAVTGGINNTAIGQLSSNVGYFTLLTASTITGDIGQVTSNRGNFTALATSSITANTINAASIGLTTSNSGYFTDLRASTITGDIGQVTSNRGNFTDLRASTITGDIGQVTSNRGNFTDLRASTFSTNIVFVTTANISTINVSTITLANSLIATTSTLGVSGYFSNTGVTAVQEIIETLNLKSTTTGVVTHDWTEGAIWYHSSMTANFSCSITNLPLIPNRSLVATLILNQGVVPYYASTLLLNGTRTNIKWASATTPTPTANRTEIESFTLFYIGTTWTALGQYTSFG